VEGIEVAFIIWLVDEIIVLFTISMVLALVLSMVLYEDISLVSILFDSELEELSFRISLVDSFEVLSSLSV